MYISSQEIIQLHITFPTILDLNRRMMYHFLSISYRCAGKKAVWSHIAIFCGTFPRIENYLVWNGNALSVQRILGNIILHISSQGSIVFKILSPLF